MWCETQDPQLVGSLHESSTGRQPQTPRACLDSQLLTKADLYILGMCPIPFHVHANKSGSANNMQHVHDDFEHRLKSTDNQPWTRRSRP